MDDIRRSPNAGRDKLLEARHCLLKLIADKDVEDHNIIRVDELSDPQRFAYEQGIREIEQRLEALQNAPSQVDVGSYAEDRFRDEDIEEQDHRNQRSEP